MKEHTAQNKTFCDGKNISFLLQSSLAIFKIQRLTLLLYHAAEIY